MHGTPEMREPWQVMAASLLATALETYRENDASDHPERNCALLLLSLARLPLNAADLHIERRVS